jgi:hypothetical protein
MRGRLFTIKEKTKFSLKTIVLNIHQVCNFSYGRFSHKLKLFKGGHFILRWLQKAEHR